MHARAHHAPLDITRVRMGSWPVFRVQLAHSRKQALSPAPHVRRGRSANLRHRIAQYANLERSNHTQAPVRVNNAAFVGILVQAGQPPAKLAHRIPFACSRRDLTRSSRACVKREPTSQIRSCREVRARSAQRARNALVSTRTRAGMSRRIRPKGTMAHLEPRVSFSPVQAECAKVGTAISSSD